MPIPRVELPVVSRNTDDGRSVRPPPYGLEDFLTPMIKLTCANCGANFERSEKIVAAGKRRRGLCAKFYCGHSCSNAGVPRRQRNPTVARYRLLEEDGTYIYEHRKIAEDMIGRPLRRNELVHHRNEVRHDNRRRNLKVMTYSEHGLEHSRITYDIKAAARMRRRGMSFAAIAKAVGAYSGSDVWRALSRRGLHKPSHRV